METKYKKLRIFNLVMAVLHGAQGVAMLFVSSDFSLPINANFLKLNPLTQKLVPDPSTIIDVKIGPAVAMFLFLSAFFHLLVSLPKVNDIYNRNLAKHINYFRWIEYSFSSTIMIIIIAMLVGIYDISALIAIAGVNISMILFGWMMELHNSSIALATGQNSKVNWTAFYFGCIAGIIPWVAIAIYLFGAPDKAPDFVYWIYLSIFVFFNCFAINQVLQYEKVGKWSDYLYGERAYIILSLVAKSLLAWQVFAGTLQPA